jgi:hypothetical protein
MVGLEAKEFIQCPHCQRIIEFDLADPGKKAIRTGPDSENYFLASNVIVSREVKKGDGTMMKTGDRFKDNTTGKIYIIRSETDSGTLFLEEENGLGRRLIGKESLRRTCEKLEDIKS